MHHVVAVVGATATGKSQLALSLAHAVDGEIINADASQLYRGMDIGTAKLPMAQREGIAHHLIDVLQVRQEASVAAYQRDARAAIADIQQRSKTAILVGGSGLYVRAALDNLDIPPTDPRVRDAWEQRLVAQGGEALHQVLQQLDPAAAERIPPTNHRRLVRALEVNELTARPFPASMPTREFRQPSLVIGLRAEQVVLDERINTRVEQMWQQGLLEEVRELDASGLRDGPTASRAIGYSQALQQLDGELSQLQAVEQTATITRKFARRQRSWFNPDQRIQWLEHDDPQLSQHAIELVRRIQSPWMSLDKWVEVNE